MSYEPHAGEQQPLGRMVAPVAHGVEIPPEPPDVGARALAVASRLLCGATTFFFLAFAFAYFYLRSLDQQHMWRPAHVNVDQVLGAAFVACLVLSALAAFVASRNVGARASGWFLPAAAATVLGLATVALQCVEYTQQSFGPTDGAFASVFCAWTGLFMIATLGALYWLQSSVASGRRARQGRRAPAGDIADPDRLIAPGLGAAAFYWDFLAAIGVLMYVVLYLL